MIVLRSKAQRKAEDEKGKPQYDPSVAPRLSDMNSDLRV